jgi:hypothetical protein
MKRSGLKRTMRLRFNEEKATQLAGMLLRLAGGRMYYLKLMKLMYLIDREGLIRWGWSMTNDRYVSMDNGCVLSRVKNLMTEETFGDSYWKRFISAPQNWQVELLGEPENDELSEAEQELIVSQYRKFQEMFGHLGADDRWALAEYTHELPEYKDPHGSSLTNTYEEVLTGARLPEDKVHQTVRSLEEFAQFEILLSK